MKKISDCFSSVESLKNGEADPSLISALSNQPVIDPVTAQVVNYIFYRLKGIIPTLRYSTESPATFDSIRREYTYEIIKQNLSSIDEINAGLERIREQGVKWLPVPGEFVEYCRPKRMQSDTRPDWMKVKGIESDEKKAKIKQAAIDNLKKMKESLCIK